MRIYKIIRQLGNTRKSVLALLFVTLLSGCASTGSNHHDTWWGHDKFLHLTVAAGIGASSANIASNFNASEDKAAIIGTTVAVLMGGLKEWYDLKAKKTYWSWKDMFWDTVGGVIGGFAGAHSRSRD